MSKRFKVRESGSDFCSFVVLDMLMQDLNMTISEIYKKYKIMSNLQLHMYRVAAVAKIICENSSTSVDTEKVIVAMLLHDTGNIIKFNLSLYPESLEPEGLEYWGKVQADFVQKYGPDEHNATYEIAREIGVSERVMELLNSVGFGRSNLIAEKDDFAAKICNYSDQRVAPYGVTSLQERLADGRKRWEKNWNQDKKEDIFHERASSLEKIEQQIFAQSKIKPEDITDEKVNMILESGELRKLSIR